LLFRRPGERRDGVELLPEFPIQFSTATTIQFVDRHCERSEAIHLAAQ
jgi:hypothetical protein